MRSLTIRPNRSSPIPRPPKPPRNSRYRPILTMPSTGAHPVASSICPSSPAPISRTVPTQEQRNGDYSQTLQANGKPYIIYDPLTIKLNPAFDPAKPVALTHPQYLRVAFPGNQVPANRFN